MSTSTPEKSIRNSSGHLTAQERYEQSLKAFIAAQSSVITQAKERDSKLISERLKIYSKEKAKYREFSTKVAEIKKVIKDNPKFKNEQTPSTFTNLEHARSEASKRLEDYNKARKKVEELTESTKESSSAALNILQIFFVVLAVAALGWLAYFLFTAIVLPILGYFYALFTGFYTIFTGLFGL